MEFRLLKKEEVKRTGAGGRHDPYIYTVILIFPLIVIQSIYLNSYQIFNIITNIVSLINKILVDKKGEDKKK